MKTKWGDGDPERGEDLRDRYMEKGLTRAQAAALLDLSVVRLWMLEIGLVSPVEDNAWSIARYRIYSVKPPAPQVDQ